MKRPFRSYRLGLFTAMITATMSIGVAGAESPPVVGREFPDFSATDAITGETIRLSELRGQVILIDFWATWCVPCRQFLPNLIAMRKKYADKGLEIIAVSLDFERDRAAYKKFVSQNQPGWLHIMDGRGWAAELATAYGVHSIPAAFLIDARGKCVADKSSLRDPDMLDILIANALANTPPTTTTAKRRAERARLEAEARREAPPMLEVARQLADAGRPDEARRFYFEIIQAYPKTEYARQAQAAVEKLAPPPEEKVAAALRASTSG